MKASDRRAYLTLISDNDREASRTSRQVASNTTDVFLGVHVRVVHILPAAGDGRAGAAFGVANLHALDRLASLLGLDRGNVEANPLAVLPIAKVEFTVCRGIRAPLAGRELLACRHRRQAALCVLVEGDVLLLSGTEGELERGLAVVPVLLAVRAELVPEADLPRLLVLARHLRDVLVSRRIAGGDLGDVAAPGIARVALVQVDGAGVGAVALAEGFGSELPVGGGGGPVSSALGVGERGGEGSKGREEKESRLELHGCDTDVCVCVIEGRTELKDWRWI